MKILLVGNFTFTSLESSYSRAFRFLGHEVLEFELPTGNRYLSIYYQLLARQRLINFLKNIKVDLILVFKGNELTLDILELIKKKYTDALFCFLSDDPFDPANVESVSPNVVASIGVYNCLFVWTKNLISPLLKKGAKRVECIPFGFDDLLHRPLKVSLSSDKIFDSDVIFIGNWTKKREEYLKNLVDYRLAIWGENYWRWHCEDRRLKACWRKKALYGKDMAAALCASKIALNIFRNQNRNNHNMRTFEQPACGVCVLSERTQEVEEFFEEDKEVILFSSVEELREKTSYYLKNDDKRMNIAKNGYSRCLESGYSYLDRARRMLLFIQRYYGKQ